jgi:hypothetical protein
MIICQKIKNRLNNIHILTFGSPRYLPKELLANCQIYNIYNINDFLKDIEKIFKSYFKIPILPKKDDKRFVKSSVKHSDGEEIYYLKNDNFIFVKFINFKFSKFFYHAHLINMIVFFENKLPNVISYLIYNTGDIYDFDRKLFKIISNPIKTINLSIELEKYDDKQIFQLYYLYFGELDFEIPDIDFNLCKDELYLLSIYQLLKIIKKI